MLRRDAVRLAYYDTCANLKLLGEIVLVSGGNVASICEGSEYDEPARPGYAPFSVRCATKHQAMELQAKTAEDRDRWIAALRSAIAHASGI